VVSLSTFVLMSKQNRKIKDVHDALMGCCLVFVILFFFNHNFSKHCEHAKTGTNQKYISSYGNSIISEKHEVKIYKPFHYVLTLLKLNNSNSREHEQKQLSTRTKDFFQIKILLKMSRYNFFFASGLHEPITAA
jgi:hypothetical protein